ncbi:amino acid ABC transporter substrate-binding protein [Prochlorococcus sp. MIT 1307]|uniref:amino acid ABC transporter substrate-binding protein n=1 Tax=Prochlorococcus sp. MIT 1307 TaxID=3096219 RepID=UPI002A758E3E|nr:amino acid ABC transporter substrate-binding protein [Prochlorococcus sp. MIT 1307]
MTRRALAGLITLGLLSSGCASMEKGTISRLDLIQKRGELKCGVSGKIPGFSFLSGNGVYKGLDVDICKAMAAAFIGNPSKVQYRPLTAPERFTALKTGEIDLLSRNTTFNLSRDASGGNGVTFAPVVFHDGQGLMVRKNSGVSSIKGLSNSTICVGSGTTTEQNLNDTFQEKNLPYKPIKYQDLNQVIAGYLQGRCKAMTSDLSQLAAARSGFPDPQEHIILDQILSKEPLAPASIDGDQKLSDAMRWVVFALIAAEEFGITQENINIKLLQAQSNENLMSLRRFLGVDGGLGKKIGLSDDFVVKVIQATGNYGEIYNRHLGPESSVPIPRGLNRIYKKGGLLISPPLK